MINSLTVTNLSNESLTFDLRRPEDSGFLISDISGLGPVVANINSTELASSDGAVYNSARLGARNIVITFIFLPNASIEDTRLLSYRLFPIKKKVFLTIKTENRICETFGYVESNSPNIFSREVGTQISIMCPDSYFFSTEINTTIFSSIIPVLAFQFFNDSLVAGISEFGQVNNLTSGIVYYEGEADVGFLMHILITGVVANLVIFNSMTGESLMIDTTRLAALTGSGLINGDEVQISTIKGDKYIILIRGGIETNILNSLTKTSDWIHLTTGDNIIGYSADSGVANVQLRVENRIVYEGV